MGPLMRIRAALVGAAVLLAALVLAATGASSGRAGAHSSPQNRPAALSAGRYVGAPEQSQAEVPIGRWLLRTRGIWTEFDDPSSSDGWHSGELLHNGNFDPALPEVVRQLDAMRAMGVNEITYELRSSAAEWRPSEFPDCVISPEVGLLWPQPTQEELTNLGRLFDLVASKGMKIALVLNNTHMEEEDRVNATSWLGSILAVVKGKSALDYIAFGGDTKTHDWSGDGVADVCGMQAEAPLWYGPSSVQGRYVQWAIGLALARGLPARQLTAEAIVGFYEFQKQMPVGGSETQDGHQWTPLEVMRTIFDRLGIPAAERTYAISWALHRKCDGPSGPACVDKAPQAWAEEMARYAQSVARPPARLTVSEFFALRPDQTVDPKWPTEKGVEGLGALMQRYGIEGGIFWRWHDVTGTNPPNGDPVKRRGPPPYVYYPVQRELADLYGFHLTAITNGSFENSLHSWKLSGRGKALRPRLTESAPWRGRRFLRLTTPSSISATSPQIRVSPSTTYTTTANLRFAWKAKPRPKTPPAKRPHVDVSFRYFTCSRHPSRARTAHVVRFSAAQSTRGFRTFPLRYRTPKDACYLQIRLVAAANARTSGMTFDVDNLR